VLDPALLRPGRFDRRVLVDRPELDARRAILDVHATGKPLATEVDLDQLARDTPGFSGADLANLINEAALAAVRRGVDEIGQVDVDAAYEKIVLGDPREGKLHPDEKRRVAVHESGHAVAAHFGPHSEPLRRVSILPRGMALGVTQQTPSEDRHIQTQPELESRLVVLLGGFAAERVVLGCVSTGAENDLKRATEIAFKMVAHFGMSEHVGPVFHEHKVEHPFLGQRLAMEGGTSDATVRQIEDEVRTLIVAAQREAERRVGEHRVELDALVDALLARETLEPEALRKLLGPAFGAQPEAPSSGVLH
jgi:cell division protease FtsH